MKLVAVTVENVRVVKQASIAFDPSRTVVGGPQEFGKSTLVEAIHNALFLKSRGTSASHKAMRSDLHPGHPAVTLSFETGGRRYTIKKTFAGNTAASATILTDEGPADATPAGSGVGSGRPLRGDEAEARIHELLQAENLGSRTVDSRLRMQWAHLWVWQGTSGHDPVAQANAEKPAEQLRDRLSRLGGGGVLESSLDAQAGREIAGRYRGIYRDNGDVRTGSDLARAIDDHEQAEAGFARAAALVKALDSAVDAIDAAETTIGQSAARLESHTTELAEVVEKLRAVNDLRVRLAEEQAAAREADAAREAIAKADAEITGCEAELTTLTTTIEPATQRLTELAAAEQAASAALTTAFDAVDSATTSQQEAAAAVALLELCEQRARLTVERHGLGGRCTRIDALRGKIAALEAERKDLAAITADDVARLERLERARDAAATTLDAIATKVVFSVGPGPVRLAGEPLVPGAAVTIAAESELVVGPTGHEAILTISPGGGRSLADATRASQQAHRELATALDALRIESAAAARQAHTRLQAIQTEIVAQEGAFESLGGDQARREYEALVAKIASVEAEIRRRAPEGFDLDVEFAPAALGEPAAAPEDPAAAIRRAETTKAAIHARLVAAHAARDAASTAAARASAAATAARKRHEEMTATHREVSESIQATRSMIDSLTARRSLLVERFGADRSAAISDRTAAANMKAAAVKSTLEQLTALAPESLVREQTRLERAITNLRTQRQDAEMARQVAREQLRREGTDDPRDDLARATVRRRLAAVKLENARREAEATKLLADLFAAKKRDVETQFVTPLSTRVADYLQTILGSGTAVEIGYTDGQFGKLSVARGEFGNVSWDFASLSGGTKEQVAAAFRLAMAEILAEGHGGTLPIIFDDAFTNADAGRQQKLQRLLDLAADRGLQVIVFSCTPEDYIGLGGREVSLPSPIATGGE